jgi:threonine/homoserine/homoserine lactone efflux protein
VALGRRAALATVAGNTAGVMVQAILVALGLGALVERSDAAFTAVKLIGAVYLVVLGLRMLRNRHGLAALHDATEVPKGTRRIVREGFIVGFTNPKAVVVFTVVIPQFADPSRGHVPLQLLVLGIVFLTIGVSPTAPGRSRPARPARGSPDRAGGSRRSRAPAAWC